MRYLSLLTWFALVVVLLMVLGCVGFRTGAESEIGMAAVCEGAGVGYRGMIRVCVGFENGTITEITVVESGEDRAVGGAAIEELTDLVLMYNTTEVDAVSGATETSRGFLEAIENAIMDK